MNHNVGKIYALSYLTSFLTVAHSRKLVLSTTFVRRESLCQNYGSRMSFIVSFLFTPSHYLFMLAHSRNESMTFCTFILPYSFNVTDLPTLISLIYPPVFTVMKTGEHFTLDTRKKYHKEGHRCRYNHIY